MTSSAPGPVGMSPLLMTRRSVIGTGLAALSVAATTGAHRRIARQFDVLLVDSGIALPNPAAAFVEAQRKLVPVVDVQLDAAGYARVKAVLGRHQAALGISSGATLFCLERIAWDCGYRLSGHGKHSLGDMPDEPSRRRELASMLNGQLSPARGYQPSQADGVLHFWSIARPAGKPHEARA